MIVSQSIYPFAIAYCGNVIAMADVVTNVVRELLLGALCWVLALREPFKGAHALPSVASGIVAANVFFVL